MIVQLLVLMLLAADVTAPPLSYRVVPLACSAGGLAISGGGVLRLSAQGSCAAVVPGRALSITLDEDGHAIPGKLDPASHAANELPRTAFSVLPASLAAPESATVIVTIVVTIPPSTPNGSAIYLSTDRSSFNPAELQMNQVDARRYRLQLPLQDGGRILFRVTRGSIATTERDAKGRLPPPHVAVGSAGVTNNVTVDAWADS
jgi:hypothetical protein